MKINSINSAKSPVFSAIYHYKLDTNNDSLGEKFTQTYKQLTKTRAGKNLAIVSQNPGLSFAINTLNRALAPKKLSAEWLDLHFKYMDYELPKPLATNVFDVFIFEGEDAKDYKKFHKNVRSFPSIVKDYVTIAIKKCQVAKTDEDAALVAPVEYYKLQQERFDDFLAGREITELDLKEVFREQGLNV